MDLATFSFYFAVGCSQLLIIPILIGLWRRRSLSKALWVFWCFLVGAFILPNISIGLAFKGIHNHFMNYFDSLNVVVLLGYYFKILFEGHSPAKWISYIIGAGVAMLFMDGFWLSGFSEVNGFSGSVINFMVLVLAFLYLKHSFSSPDSYLQEPNVYICIGLLVAFIAEFIFSLFKEKLLHTDATYRVYFEMANLKYFFKLIAIFLYSVSFKKIVR